MKYAIGIDVGGTHIKLGLFDPQMKCVCFRQFPVDPEIEAIGMMDFITAQVRSNVANAGLSMEDVRGVGAGFPSYIDYEHGVVLETSNIVALADQPVRDMLAERLGVPVYLDNDGNVAALAEHRFGAAQGYDNFIYATLATGIGGALFINGKLYRGMHGMAGEIGHMFVSDSTGYPCGCGVSGCVQSIASGVHMARYAMDRIKEGEESAILDYAGTLATVDMVAVGRALKAHDPLALEVVNRGAEYIARMFHSLNQVFDINVFIYGGGICNIGHPFTDRMIARYRHHSLMDVRYPAQFIPAALGDQAGVVGAALLVPEEQA